MTHPDGQLPPALTELEHAINALIRPLSDEHGHLAVSYYRALCDAATAQYKASNHHVPRSLPPLNVDALDLRIQIDTRIAIEQPAGTTTPDRLNRITQRAWRPQDVHWLEQFTRALQSWTAEIRELLNPTPKPTMPAPCPQCDVALVYRRDPAGEQIRQPALQFGPKGCICQNCRTTWPPEHWGLLAAILDTQETRVVTKTTNM